MAANNVAVRVGGDIWTVVHTQEEADDVIKGIEFLNRWFFSGGRKAVDTRVTSSRVTDPFKRKWWLTYQAGRAGWDCQPCFHEEQEKVIENHPTLQSAVVFAPTAELAIARAQYLLMEAGRKE